jgi:hypothetical protein
MRSPLLICPLLFAIPSLAWGAEGEAVVAVEPGWAIQSAPERTEHTFAAGASLWLGLTDSVWAAASLGFTGPGGDFRSVEACGGLVLALDVLRVIPFLEAQAGLLASGEQTTALVRLGFGADYFLTERLSVGAVARYRPLPSELGDGLVTVEARLAFRLEL